MRVCKYSYDQISSCQNNHKCLVIAHKLHLLRKVSGFGKEHVPQVSILYCLSVKDAEISMPSVRALFFYGSSIEVCCLGHMPKRIQLTLRKLGTLKYRVFAILSERSFLVEAYKVGRVTIYNDKNKAVEELAERIIYYENLMVEIE